MARGLFITGSIFMIASLLLPWIYVDEDISMWGNQTAGIYVALIGVACLVIGITRKGEPGKSYFVAGILLPVLAYFLISGFMTYITSEKVVGKYTYLLAKYTSYGLHSAIIGFVLVLLGSLLKVKSEPKTKTRKKTPS